MYSNCLEIDKDRLDNELQKRGLSKAGVSRELGFSSNYISSVCHRGIIPQPAVNLLHKFYNISFDDYKKKDSEVPTTVEIASPSVVLSVDYDKLYQTIYAAVYEAVKKAWSE